MRKSWLLLQAIVVLAAILGNVAKAAISVPSKDKFKILGLFPHFGKSHFDVFRPLLEELARRGHDVTVVSYFPLENGREIKGYKDVNLLEDPSNVRSNFFEMRYIDHTFKSSLVELHHLSSWGISNCRKVFNNTNFLRLVRSNEKFDLILTEVFDTDCYLGFVHRFKAPFISLSSHQLMPWVSHRVNNPDNPSYIAGIFHQLSPRMSFVERLVNTVGIAIQQIWYEIGFNWRIQADVEKVFGPGVPPLREIAKNTSAILANIHYTLHGARPNLPNVIEVGGIHIGNVKPLPDDIKRFLDDAHEGALLFSWGSMVRTSSLPKEKLDDILKVFGSIPRKIIWKWEDENLPGKPANVMVKKWLPQFDVMNHPNVKCYLAHGGNLGLAEGVYSGLPMVIVPMYGDQFHNAAAAVARGVAILLSYEQLNEKTLRDALDRVFNDTSYQTNAQALSRAYKDRPASPLETAVWWTEYFARGNGSPFVRSSGADLSWCQYHLLDVFGFLIVLSLIGIYVTYRLFRFLFSVLPFGRSTSANLRTGRKKND